MTLLVVPAVVVALVFAYWFLWKGYQDSLVVYCAHDAVYAEKVLRDFERRTGIPLDIRYDTEATKSLGLVELLIREKDYPRCDVFWNNELLGIADLQERGILHPYKGSGFARIPTGFKDPDGHWVGFAARMRVYIVNTEKMKCTEQAIADRLAGDLSRVAIAKPLYGTTLTHYSVLWHLWGPEKLKGWHHDCHARGIAELTGNADVKNSVAQGVCDFGFTDTDDFYVAKDEGKPVDMLPVRLENGTVICIPNTVAIVKGTRHLEAAQQLVDYLLSEDCELALANSKSRQIPLGPVDRMRLTEEVKELKAIAQKGYPLTGLREARAQCLSWLKSEY